MARGPTNSAEPDGHRICLLRPGLWLAVTTVTTYFTIGPYREALNLGFTSVVLEGPLLPSRATNLSSTLFLCTLL